MHPARPRIGAFSLHGVIGRGGMGEVRTGRHRPSGVPVAIKLLRAGSWGTMGLDLFRQEVRAVASLDHPNVVMVLDHGLVTAEEAKASRDLLIEGTPWLAMELCTGGTLFDMRGRTPWPALRSALLSLLDGLAHSHARGVIHRDLKPGNVLLGADGDLRPGLKLTDFGIARVNQPGHDEVLDRDTFAGSPSYAAPEQLEGRGREVGPWTDLFALGCLAWTLCTGSPPRGGRPLAALVRSRVRGDHGFFEPVLPVPDGFEPWLQQLLQPAPEDRFLCAADAAWALRSNTPEPDTEELLRVDLPALGAIDQATVTTPRRSSPVGATAVGVTELMTEIAGRPARTITRIARAEATRNKAPTSPRVGRVRAPMVDDWRGPTAASPPTQLLGAGLGLYGLRALPMVGRAAEQDLLWGAMHDVARTGASRCVLVEGPAGVGKTRLLQWLASRAQELGVATVVRAVHGDPAGPVDGMGAALERAFRLEGLDGRPLEQLARRRLDIAGLHDPWLASAIAELVRPGATSRREGPRVNVPNDVARLEVMTDALRALAQDRPVLLWLDDLQWGAEAAALASRLVRGAAADRLPILVMGTVRTPVAPSTPGRAALDALAERGISRVSLGRLPEEDQRRLVTDLLRLHGSLVDEVLARTGGNPLFAVQLVGDWIRRGELVSTEAGWQRQAERQIALPDDLHALWSQRFTHALEGARDETLYALELAAALGLEVDAGEWLAICYRSSMDASGLVERLVTHGLVARTRRGFTFVHGMARESMCRASREAGRWPELNAHCARHLQTAHEPNDIVRRGRHRLEAGQYTAAVGDLRLGIQICLKRGRTTAAVELLSALDQALEASNLPDDDQRVLSAQLLHFKVRRAHNMEVDVDGVATLLARARESGHPHVECDAQREYGVALRTKRKVKEAAKELQESADLCQALSYPEGEGRALISLAYCLQVIGRRGQASEAFTRALDVLTPLGDWQGIGQAWRGLAELANRAGDRDEARRLLDKALAVAHRTGDAAAESAAALLLASGALAVGDLDDASEWLDNARTAATRTGQVARLSDIHNLRGELHRKRGEFHEAEAAYREALAITESAGIGWTFVAQLNIAMCMMEGGRFALALHPLQQARAALEAMGHAPMLTTTDVLLLAPLAASNQWTTFDATLARVEEQLPSHQRKDEEVLQALRWAAPLVERAGTSDRARRVAALAQGYARHLGRQETE